MKIYNNIIYVYVVLTLVFFNVIYDNDIFYNVSSSIRYVLNISIYHIVLFITIIRSFLYYLQKKAISYVFIFGCLFITWNLFLELNNSLVDYGYFGFILLTYGAVSNIDKNAIRRIIWTSYFIFFIFFILNILNYFIPSFKSPISLIRSEELLSISGEFRLINPNLFAQSNAAGSFFAMMLIFLFLKRYLFSKIEYILLFSVSLLFIISSASFTSMIISLAIIFYGCVKYLTNSIARIFLILCVTSCLFFLVDYTFLNNTSLFIKSKVFLDYISLIMSNPNYLIFGYNLFSPRVSEPIYTESSFLDFYANFGLVGIFFILQTFFRIFWFNYRYYLYDYFFSVIFLFTIILVQNSSLLPGNILLILLISKNYK